MLIRAAALALTVWGAVRGNTPPAAAQEDLPPDVALLASGGQLSGRVSEGVVDGRSQVQIETANGQRLVLPKEHVRIIRRPKEEHAEYMRLRAQMEETIDGHWQMSEWCRENLESRYRRGPQDISPERREHLQQILRLDPDHKQARALLGYTRQDGVWVNLEQVRLGHGLVQKGKRWVPPEQAAIDEAAEQWKAAEARWKGQLRKWRSVPLASVSAAIREIRDPAAVVPLVDAMKQETQLDWQLAWVEGLGSIPTHAAAVALIEIAVVFPQGALRERSLSQLKQAHFDPARTAHYIQGLLIHSHNDVVNRAGFLLGELAHDSSLLPLIAGLNTDHVVANPRAGSPDRIDIGFSSDGVSGMQMGNTQPRARRVSVQNHGVLDALRRLTQANFDFDEGRWKEWYNQSRTLNGVEMRRDETP